MNIKDYLQDRQLFIIMNIVLLISVSIFLQMFGIGFGVILVIASIWLTPLILYITMEYFKNKKFYDNMEVMLRNLDKKFLLPEVIEEPDFIEGKVVYDILKETHKDMHENVKKYRDIQNEYQEYIEAWVHEIKTPVASTMLIIKNNQTQITKNIEYEIKKIEEYIEQALYYSKSNNVNKDYIIKEVSLDTLTKNIIKKNSRDFINKKISIDIDAINGTVYSDIKWLEFILNQIIGNAVKYCKEKKGRVSVYTQTNENNVILTISDNGVGIEENDLKSVFEKGFTGINGRIFGKSTGIGLYLCKKLCDKLGLGLSLYSEVNKGTKIT